MFNEKANDLQAKAGLRHLSLGSDRSHYHNLQFVEDLVFLIKSSKNRFLRNQSKPTLRELS